MSWEVVNLEIIADEYSGDLVRRDYEYDTGLGNAVSCFQLYFVTAPSTAMRTQHHQHGREKQGKYVFRQDIEAETYLP